MLSLDAFSDVMEELVEELPDELFAQLNGGVQISEDASLHPKDRDHSLYILGQYRIDPVLGRSVVIYYGSFCETYSHLSDAALKEKLRDTLRHELRHHIETQAGCRDLEDWDAAQISAYQDKFKPSCDS